MAVGVVVLAQSLFSGAWAEGVGVGGDTAPIDVSSLSPAFSTVEGVDLFPNEKQQLTDSVLTNLTQLGIDTTLFTFSNPSSSIASLNNRSGSCKVFPGDPHWPSSASWKLLDFLSGGALIKTIPSAAVCYEGWGNTNEGGCEY
ncbi:hypothetical protein V491_04304, partial [Pseudogymnoascus sp. VKM F-3775]